jgi:hypothetical protein
LVSSDDSYGEIDYIYGKKAYINKNGFTNAQSSLNVIEVLLQIWFLRIRRDPSKQNKALLVGYTVSVMSLSKTILYWLQEYFSGYQVIEIRLIAGMPKSVIIPSTD